MLMATAENQRLRTSSVEDVVSCFGSLVNNADCSDVTFVFDEGEPVPGHRAILASRCAHFRNMFLGTGASMVEGRERDVRIRDCPREAFLVMLELLYTGATDAADTVLLVEAHRLLDRYGMHEMAMSLHQGALASVSEGTVLPAMEAAHKGGCEALLHELARKFISYEGAVYGESLQLASHGVLLAIARISASTKTPSKSTSVEILKAWGRIRCGQVFKRKRGDEESAGTCTIQGNGTGFHVALLKVPSPRMFSVSGTFKGSNDLALWVHTRSASAKWALPSPDRSRWSVQDGAVVHLKFGSSPSPRASLWSNGVEICSMVFPDGTAEFAPAIFIGDQDSLLDVQVE